MYNIPICDFTSALARLGATTRVGNYVMVTFDLALYLGKLFHLFHIGKTDREVHGLTDVYSSPAGPIPMDGGD